MSLELAFRRRDAEVDLRVIVEAVLFGKAVPVMVACHRYIGTVTRLYKECPASFQTHCSEVPGEAHFVVSGAVLDTVVLGIQNCRVRE